MSGGVVTLPTLTFYQGGSRFWRKGSWAGRLPWVEGLWRPGWWRLAGGPLCHTTVWSAGAEERQPAERPLRANRRSNTQREQCRRRQLHLVIMWLHVHKWPSLLLYSPFREKEEDVYLISWHKVTCLAGKLIKAEVFIMELLCQC